MVPSSIPRQPVLILINWTALDDWSWADLALKCISLLNEAVLVVAAACGHNVGCWCLKQVLVWGNARHDFLHAGPH